MTQANCKIIRIIALFTITCNFPHSTTPFIINRQQFLIPFKRYPSITTTATTTTIPRHVLTNKTPIPKIPPPQQPPPPPPNNKKLPTIVLVSGFESFNRHLYTQSAHTLPPSHSINLHVFSDSDIRLVDGSINPAFESAVSSADAFVGSLIFDYDDVMAVKGLLDHVKGPRLLFECATELMSYNRLGGFRMGGADGDDTAAAPAMGPPPAVKALLSKFSSGREEDKLQGYLKMLKVGPDLLKFVPGEKANDLRSWLEAYRYWNQGGETNVSSLFLLLSSLVQKDNKTDDHQQQQQQEDISLPPLVVTPDVGLIHPLHADYFPSPSAYLSWRLSPQCLTLAQERNMTLAPSSSTTPRVAVLLYRKHVITSQRYINDLITMMESQGILPIPIFINGVEAHTIVRDWLTSPMEDRKVRAGHVIRSKSYDSSKAASVDAVVNTIGFPLVGGPAGSMEAGRNVDLAGQLLRDMDVPYIVASPLLLQSIPQWRKNGVLGLQSVCLYALPELDGAIDTIVLGGLVGDKIALVPERVRKLCSRLHAWYALRQTPVHDRRVAISLYGFPPNVGAVGTAALLDVPSSLSTLLTTLKHSGYDVGSWNETCSNGQSLVAALAILSENPVISAGSSQMSQFIAERIERAKNGDVSTAECLANPNGGLGGATVHAFDISRDELNSALGPLMAKKVSRSWPESDRGPGVSSTNHLVVSGLQLGNVWITVQPLLGVEGDPMRLLFERDLTPHPQYCAGYEWMKRGVDEGGVGAQAVIHLGMHGTVEWLPGQQLGNDRQSWSDELLGHLPNIYVYAANNPSESILAKRRGYGTLVSYNVPPYGRAGLYLELANLKDLIDEYRMISPDSDGGVAKKRDLREGIYSSCDKSEITRDVPLAFDSDDENFIMGVPDEQFDEWVKDLSEYLVVLQDRLFSSGLHTLGAQPTNDELDSYLSAYFGDRLSNDEITNLIATTPPPTTTTPPHPNPFQSFLQWLQNLLSPPPPPSTNTTHQSLHTEARLIITKLLQTPDELTSILTGLNGGYIRAAPGGDLLRDGSSVLPTGRNIHALDPYRMPSAGAWARGQAIANDILERHVKENDGNYPETVAVTLWGLDAIKTRGESVAIVLSLVGARPVKEGTGRVVSFELIPVEELGRPRVDVLASMSGIFRDSFANLVDLLDDMFERAASAPLESITQNYIKKHAQELIHDHNLTLPSDRPAARLFSNPPGDYGSMVNEIVNTGEWTDDKSLGDTWASRNVHSYGRNEGMKEGGGAASKARPEVLNKLLATTERVVQEIDSVEYGITDIQEYYANTGALKKAAENRNKDGRKVTVSVVESFGGGPSDNTSSGGSSGANATASTSKMKLPVRDLEDVLRIEYRTKLLNPKWRDAMLAQGSGGAFEISQRMTAMIGWAATTQSVDNFVFDQTAERYALDDSVARQLQRSNPEAFKNVVRRLLEANGRGMWEAEESVLEKLRDLYSDADDLVEGVANTVMSKKK